MSPPTDRKILEEGVRLCVGEACLPVKVYFGHVSWLQGRADLIFVPRYTSIHRREYICPKFGGLPDMIRASFGAWPPLLSPEINLRASRKGLLRAALDAAASLGVGDGLARRACAQIPRLAGELRRAADAESPQNDGKIPLALMGHSYLVHDAFINHNLIGRLEALGARVLLPDPWEGDGLRAAATVAKPLFWTYGAETVGTASRLADRGGAQGALFLSSFGCGVDSFVGMLAERRVRAAGLPFAALTLDEHTADAGLETRLEAFMDTLSRRRSHDCHLSPHGQRLYDHESPAG